MSLQIDIMSIFIREKSTYLKAAEGLLHVHGRRLRYLRYHLSLLCHFTNKGNEAKRRDLTLNVAEAELQQSGPPDHQSKAFHP